VLVVGAGGGLGSLLVQLARAAGARVIAAARGERKQDLACKLGAETVVDYSGPDWGDHVREATAGSGADVVFDGVGGRVGRAAFELTARGGQFSAHGAPSGDFAAIDEHDAQQRAVTVRGIERVQFAPADARRLAERALSEAAAGHIKPVIGQTFALDRAPDAHAAIEARSALGKTLLLTERST
jgi:NADPH2:quinone reductase